jgi:hypothetical protein
MSPETEKLLREILAQLVELNANLEANLFYLRKQDEDRERSP